MTSRHDSEMLYASSGGLAQNHHHHHLQFIFAHNVKMYYT